MKKFFRVTDLVQTRLIESGWKDKVRYACRQAILEYNEAHNRTPTVDELITLITPQAREMVPQNVKHELLNRIETILKDVDASGYRKTF